MIRKKAYFLERCIGIQIEYMLLDKDIDFFPLLILLSTLMDI